MPTTSNFGWTTPADTDLVKDGAAAIRTLGNGIDTSLVDLKGGTTGQVLSKASNTDLDYTWVTTDDANAIQNAIVDAKGDLIAASAADTPARLAVGSNGETLVADSSASTGLRWQGNYAAGKNAIINGDFNIWQRGTSFSNPASSAYLSDRWFITYNGSGATRTITRETFTPGAAPVAGYEGNYFLRYARTVAGTSATADRITQRIENVTTLAGQTITISFWAKVDSGTPVLTVQANQSFGSGGSGDVAVNSTVTLSTTWTRYSVVLAIPSISGKTIGANSFLEIQLRTPVNTIQTFDFWGVQAEAGSVATPFTTATGTLAGELAACQRYYFRQTATAAFSNLVGFGYEQGATSAQYSFFPVQTMRVKPSSVDFSAIKVSDYNSSFAITAFALNGNNADGSYFLVDATIASGGTAGRPCVIQANNNSAAYIGFSAEL